MNTLNYFLDAFSTYHESSSYQYHTPYPDLVSSRCSWTATLYSQESLGFWKKPKCRTKLLIVLGQYQPDSFAWSLTYMIRMFLLALKDSNQLDNKIWRHWMNPDFTVNIIAVVDSNQGWSSGLWREISINTDDSFSLKRNRGWNIFLLFYE